MDREATAKEWRSAFDRHPFEELHVEDWHLALRWWLTSIQAITGDS
jgi:hypothetical protein